MNLEDIILSMMTYKGKPAKIQQLTIPTDKRVICISDIHGSLDLFVQLLGKVGFSGDDILILIGDLFMRGTQCHETLKYIIELSRKDNVHAVMGNWDAVRPYYLTGAEAEWLDNLPQIIETQDYVFVHGGLTSNNLHEQDALTCMKNDAFIDQGLSFEKYIVTGHWPTANYCHEIPSNNPFIDREKRIIAVDGGIVIRASGQLNAFIISDGAFSFEYVDALPVIQVQKAQPESGRLHITWNDRFVELVSAGEEFSIYRHLETGKTLSLPNDSVWTDEDGNLCAADGTDYHLHVEVGDNISVVKTFNGKLLAKKNGILGWVNL